MVEAHQPVRLVERQRLQDHAVDNAEDGRRRADPQRERDYRDAGEPAFFPQCARRIAQIVGKRRQQMPCGSSGHRGDRRARLPERRHAFRQGVGAAEFRERGPRRLVGRDAAGDELLPAVLEVLRQLLDNLELARGREPQRRQTGSNLPRPVIPRLRSG
jgi:hypothetical protein